MIPGVLSRYCTLLRVSKREKRTTSWWHRDNKMTTSWHQYDIVTSIWHRDLNMTSWPQDDIAIPWPYILTTRMRYMQLTGNWNGIAAHEMVHLIWYKLYQVKTRLFVQWSSIVGQTSVFVHTCCTHKLVSDISSHTSVGHTGEKCCENVSRLMVSMESPNGELRVPSPLYMNWTSVCVLQCVCGMSGAMSGSNVCFFGPSSTLGLQGVFELGIWTLV